MKEDLALNHNATVMQPLDRHGKVIRPRQQHYRHLIDTRILIWNK